MIRTLLDLLRQLPQDLKRSIRCICIDGTSSTALLVDERRGDVLAPTKLYNESQTTERLTAVKVRAAATCSTKQALHWLGIEPE